MNPWIALLSPLAVGALIIGGLRAYDRIQRWRYARAVRIRNDKMRMWGMAPYEPSARQKRL